MAKKKKGFFHADDAEEVAKQVVGEEPEKAMKAHKPKRELPKDAINGHSKFDKFKGEK